jgi:hypothetical protein
MHQGTRVMCSGSTMVEQSMEIQAMTRFAPILAALLMLAAFVLAFADVPVAP